MFRKIIFTIAIIIEATLAMAQQIPVGECGIVYIHDAAGNRTKRLYYCNNGGPYPSFRTEQQQQITFAKANDISNAEKNNHVEFARIDAIVPNPTSGKFSITFSKELLNATIAIIDVNGKTVQQSKQSGNKLNFDIYNQPAGIYFVKIIDGNNVISKKILKN